MEVIHNLPDPPYRVFYGRQKALEDIKEHLLQGGTYIASLDGVGGMGKTALAYRFCQEYLLHDDRFDYIVWISAKNTQLNPFSQGSLIEGIQAEPFQGIQTLIDTTFKLLGRQELIIKSLEEKIEFFQTEVLSNEKIFFVLDNLETIDDETFFQFLSRNFNKYSRYNPHLKILATSRKRKRMADFPISIEGLDLPAAYQMLIELAQEYKIHSIINSTEKENTELIEKVGSIPLGILFIIGQMKNGKSRTDIENELRGYPSTKGIDDPAKRQAIMSEIIEFSFSGMYESLSLNHQYIFKLIAIFSKNASDIDITRELLLAVNQNPDINMNKMYEILEDLLESNLIKMTGGKYYMAPNAINFVRNKYSDFANFENQMIKHLNLYSKSDPLDTILEDEQIKYLMINHPKEAEKRLRNYLDIQKSDKIYHQIALINSKYHSPADYTIAEDYFRKTIDENVFNLRAWIDWIDMERNRNRADYCIHLLTGALRKTNYHVDLVKLYIDIYLQDLKNYEKMSLEMVAFLKFYKEENREWEFLHFSEYCKVIIDNGTIPQDYFIDVLALIKPNRNKTQSRVFDHL